MKEKFRVMLNPGDDDVPESSLCKKKCLFFVNRISSIYRRERPFTLGGANTELKQYSEESAKVCLSILLGMGERCTKHLEKVQSGENQLTEGVDMEIILIKL